MESWSDVLGQIASWRDIYQTCPKPSASVLVGVEQVLDSYRSVGSLSPSLMRVNVDGGVLLGWYDEVREYDVDVPGVVGRSMSMKCIEISVGESDE